MTRAPFILLALLPLGPAPAARAESQVNVEVVDSIGRPMDGTSTLTGQGISRSCHTIAARCTVWVPAGTYALTLGPVRESPPPPRTLVVQAGGVAQIVLRSVPGEPTPTVRSRVSIRIVDSAGRPVNGTATLTGPGCQGSCRTAAGRCTMTVPTPACSELLAPGRTPPLPLITVVVRPPVN